MKTVDILTQDYIKFYLKGYNEGITDSVNFLNEVAIDLSKEGFEEFADRIFVLAKVMGEHKMTEDMVKTELDKVT